MDGIGKVDRGGARRKILHISRGGKAVHAFIEEGKIGLYHLHKFLGVGLILLPLQNFAEPLHFRHLGFGGLILRAAFFLVLPVGGNTETPRFYAFQRYESESQRALRPVRLPWYEETGTYWA